MASPNDSSRRAEGGLATGWVLALIVIGLIYVVALIGTGASVIGGDPSRTNERWFAGLVAIGLLVVFTIVLGFLKINVTGLVIGADQRLSTSKLQALLWTYTLLGILLAIVVADWIGQSESFTNLVDAGLPEEYLILLGGPFAAAVAAKAIVSTKVEDGTVTKTEGREDASASERLGEAFSNDEGNTSLVDTQYLLFNFLALLYVIGGFIADPSEGVPDIPGLVVGLTSVSAATYVSSKAVQRDVPALTGIVPARGAAGTKVRVFGRNLLIPYGRGGYRSVFILFDGEEAQPVGLRKAGDKLVDDDGDAEYAASHSSSGDDQLWVAVPEGLEARTVKVSTRNFKGVASSNELDFQITT